ncbi:GNAT family N-acetyltransferase [Brevibacillus laterosporus]|uniref:GNAT family N-acetyltransferase n=1 Tax=Brevibacillus laterosporus TaxID=1465 RepID=UPI000CE3F9B4|nr:GNAT family N-acetyltransferase [Brevibacillus laterosporus]MBG9772886.1 acetyltransferase [Brevibacillus laterosporus]PPA87264.1 GNAT family N-acetyltransferase [Brevibacillus laterosporus]
MITFKRLSQLTFEEAVQLWNAGFSEYFVDIQVDTNSFLKRLGKDELSPDLSIVAFEDEEPIGFILTGWRIIKGKKVAWNGGTAIKPEWRGRGVGKLLMKELLSIYEEINIDVATLEAIAENKSAISLYEKMGYKVAGRIILVKQRGALKKGILRCKSLNSYILKQGMAAEALSIPFYQIWSPYQAQAMGIQDGESVIAYNEEGQCVGYALYRRIFNHTGKMEGVTLHQCELNPQIDRKERDVIMKELLTYVLSPELENIERNTNMIISEESRLYSLLLDLGFTLRIEQVYMINQMKNK